MFKKLIVFLIGLVSLIYLANPTAGFIEFIPDNIPFIGNLDEVAATALLLAAFQYFGVDLTGFMKKSSSQNSKSDSDQSIK